MFSRARPCPELIFPPPHQPESGSGRVKHKARRFEPRTVSFLGFWTDDVKQAYRTLRDKGVAVGGPPSEVVPLPGIHRRAFSFTGPNGIRLEIAERD